MEIKKQLAICMDHLNAHVMEYKREFVGKRIIYSGALTETENNKELTSGMVMLNKAGYSKLAGYYKELCEIIKNFEEVLLFGPADAKFELLNILAADQHFSHIKIELKTSDKLSDIKQYDFVKDYFSHV